MVAQYLKQIGKVKKLDKLVPHEQTANQKKKKKNHRFEVSSSLIISNNNKPFFNQIMTFNEKWISYNNQVSG